MDAEKERLSGKIKIKFTEYAPDARYIKSYKAYCKVHKKHCTHYDCPYVLKALQNIFGINKKIDKMRKSIPLFTHYRLKQTFSLINKLKGTLLDIGCGTGEIHKLHSDWKIVGLDASQEKVNYANKNRVSSKHKYVQGDINMIKRLGTKKFSAISLLELIEHLPERKVDELLEECHRLLKQDGILLISVPNKFYPELIFGKILGRKSPVGYSRTHFRNYSSNMLIKLMKKHGFRIMKIRGYHLFIPFLATFLGEEPAIRLKTWASWRLPIISQSIIIKAKKEN